MKKAELSMSTIVMAVIALLVLIILSFMVLNQMGVFNDGIGACATGEVCVVSQYECEGYDITIPRECNDNGVKGNFCCRSLGSRS